MAGAGNRFSADELQLDHGSDPQSAAKIREYAVIGDCRSAALVSKFGSIDWLCWPRFNSGSIFAAILDGERGGFWSIAPREPFHSLQRYVPATNLLETEFSTSSGSAILLDFMPVGDEPSKRRALLPEREIVRELRCTGGTIAVRMEFEPRAWFGLRPLSLHMFGQNGLRIASRPGVFWLRGSVPIALRNGGAAAEFTLQAGETAQFALSYAEESPAALPLLGEPVRMAAERSMQWWQDWSRQSKYRGRYEEEVQRSALAVKLLTYAPTGAIVAAATSSLPERIGDSLNWDYRFCWLRDASLTVRALLGLGYKDEAEGFLSWLMVAAHNSRSKLRVAYDVYGQGLPREREVAGLRGHRDSRPVRQGNQVRDQLQLDLYGEVLEAAAHVGEEMGGFDRATEKSLVNLGRHVAKGWDRPDQGMWESRGKPESHTHSRLMSWTALDRLLGMAEKGLVHDVPVREFSVQRDKIRRQIEGRCWNAQMGTYVSTLDGNKLDACLLRLSRHGYEAADSERMKATWGKIREQLDAGHGLLYRNRRNPPEGAFGACGFWAVEYLAMGGGTLESAHELFRKLLEFQNHAGLFSEEIDPASGDALGNFPQAFTHVGLINAALTLDEQERGEQHPAHHRRSSAEAGRTNNSQSRGRE